MNADEALPRTLADQAADWVPPWARQPDQQPEPEPTPDKPIEPAAPGPVPPVAIEPAAPQLADLDADADAEVEVVAVAEPEPEPVHVPDSEGPDSEGPDSEGPDSEGPDSEGPDSEGPDSEGPDSEGPDSEGPDSEGTAEEAEPIDLAGPLEAILLVVDEPVSEVMLAQVLEQPTDRVTAALAELASQYADGARGFDLRRAAGGWRLYTRGDYASYVERFVLDGQQIRLTQAALETLAVVAYKQPVTRSRISAIRGVNCDGVVRTLVTRGLVEECGSEPDSGAFLYRTTPLFLEKLGLDSLAQLPPLAPFLPDDVDEIADAQR
jgi:segregation and condensation protein B